MPLQYVQEEALAGELAGLHYHGRGQNRIAQHYFRDAAYAYERWGSAAKVNDLKERYPQYLSIADGVLASRTHMTTSATGSHVSAALDLTSVLKASQAISGEIDLGRLLDRLMTVVIENAGAQRGFLLLENRGKWQIEEPCLRQAYTTPPPPSLCH